MPRKPKRITDRLRRGVIEAEAGGMTRGQIARASGVSTSTITNLLDGTSANPRLDTAEAIAQAIGLKFDLTKTERVSRILDSKAR